MLVSKPIAYITTVLFFVLLYVVSAPVFAENLIQVYQHAKQNDAQLQISEAGFLATLENRPQALSGLKPQVILSGSASQNLSYAGRTVISDAHATFFNLAYDLTLTKSLFDKQLDAQISQVDASIFQAKANLEANRQDLIIRVGTAYFAFLDAKETLIFAKAEKKAIGRQLNQAKAFFEAGRSAITDVKEAQAQYDLSVAAEVAANEQIDLSRESLRAITTRYYKNLHGAVDNTPLLVPKPNNIELWAKSAIANSRQVLAAQYAVNVAQKSIDIEHAERSPKISLYANHTDSSSFGNDSVDKDVLGLSAGVQLSVPLYTGGRIASKVRQARHTLRQSRQQLELQKRLANQQTRAAYLTIISGLSQIKALKQALISTQAAANATEAGFEAGTRTAVDVLLSIRETFSAKRDYTTARYAFMLNTLKLKQAEGTLSEADVRALSKLLSNSNNPVPAKK